MGEISEITAYRFAKEMNMGNNYHPLVLCVSMCENHGLSALCLCGSM